LIQEAQHAHASVITAAMLFADGNFDVKAMNCCGTRPGWISMR
jgi:hypothetical protein